MAKKSSLRKLLNLLLVVVLISLATPVDARRNASLVEFVSGSQDEMNLFILDKDIEIDLANETASLRMLMDSKPLLVQNSYPQSFKIITYSFDADGEKVLQSTVQQTIRRRNRAKLRFTVDLGYVEGDQDLYFDFYDSADRLVNTYRQTIDFSNLQEQVADTSPIIAADCDNTSFNDCHLDYIMDKINFLVEPKNTNFSNKVKNPNGTYNVVLSIPKSVKEQILRGNFDIQAAGLGALGGSNGDNLGNHKATQDLNMNGREIKNLTNITVGQDLFVANGAYLDHLKMEDNGSISIPFGAANGYVLTSDSNGNATWQSLSSAMNGDNLGNHMATQDLDMKNFNIDNANMLAAESVKINGALAFTAGAVDGFVLTSDSNGNGHWRPINTVVNGDGLGNHRADINLDMNGNNIIAAQTINADTLAANSLDVTTINTGAQIHAPTLKGVIDVNGYLLIPEGATAGYVLTSDTNGKAAWATSLGGGGNGDNLGNHIATTALNMNNNSINTVNNITMFGNLNMNGGNLNNFGIATGNQISTSIGNVTNLNATNLVATDSSLEDVTINGVFNIPGNAAIGKVLTSDANGLASWQLAQTSNYIPPTYLSLFNLDVLSHAELQNVNVNGDLMISNGAGLGKVLTSDANGNASWQIVSGGGNGDNLGNHTATMDLDVDSFNIKDVGSLTHIMGNSNGVSAVSVNWATTNIQQVILFGNATLTFTNNPMNSAELTLLVKQDGTGGRTLTYPASVKWANSGVAPTLSTNGNSLDLIDCLYVQITSDYLCNLRANDYQ